MRHFLVGAHQQVAAIGQGSEAGRAAWKHDETMPLQFQVANDFRSKQTVDITGGGNFEAPPQFFGHDTTADQLTAFQDQNLPSCPRQVSRGHKAVMPCTHNNRVVGHTLVGPSFSATTRTINPSLHQDGKRVLWTRSPSGENSSQKLNESFKANPTFMGFHDADQDGLQDLVVLIPYEKMKILRQVPGKDFEELDIAPPGGSLEQPWMSACVTFFPATVDNGCTQSGEGGTATCGSRSETSRR